MLIMTNKEEVLVIRLSSEQKQIIKEMAKVKHMTMTNLVWHLVLLEKERNEEKVS